MAKKFNSQNAASYSSDYTPDKLFAKIGKVAKKAGVKVVYAALLLYYALFDDNVPAKDKMLVAGALGYFILPLDLIPDFMPGVGYTDDLGALGIALKSIWSNITDATRQKAQDRLEGWFDNVSKEDLKLF